MIPLDCNTHDGRHRSTICFHSATRTPYKQLHRHTRHCDACGPRCTSNPGRAHHTTRSTTSITSRRHLSDPVATAPSIQSTAPRCPAARCDTTASSMAHGRWHAPPAACAERWPRGGSYRPRLIVGGQPGVGPHAIVTVPTKVVLAWLVGGWSHVCGSTSMVSPQDHAHDTRGHTDNRPAYGTRLHSLSRSLAQAHTVSFLPRPSPRSLHPVSSLVLAPSLSLSVFLSLSPRLTLLALLSRFAPTVHPPPSPSWASEPSRSPAPPSAHYPLHAF